MNKTKYPNRRLTPFGSVGGIKDAPSADCPNVQINAQGGRAGPDEVEVLSVAPSGRRRACEVQARPAADSAGLVAIFQPDEVGECMLPFGLSLRSRPGPWQIGILFAGEHIRGSPFACQVFDASRVQVSGLDMGLVGRELSFGVDARQAGQGQVQVSAVFRFHT